MKLLEEYFEVALPGYIGVNDKNIRRDDATMVHTRDITSITSVFPNPGSTSEEKVAFAKKFRELEEIPEQTKAPHVEKSKNNVHTTATNLFKIASLTVCHLWKDESSIVFPTGQANDSRNKMLMTFNEQYSTWQIKKTYENPRLIKAENNKSYAYFLYNNTDGFIEAFRYEKIPNKTYKRNLGAGACGAVTSRGNSSTNTPVKKVLILSKDTNFGKYNIMFFIVKSDPFLSQRIVAPILKSKAVQLQHYVDGYALGDFIRSLASCEYTSCQKDIIISNLNKELDDLLIALLRMSNRGYTHCDLHEGNIMYDRKNGRFCVIDWDNVATSFKDGAGIIESAIENIRTSLKSIKI